MSSIARLPVMRFFMTNQQNYQVDFTYRQFVVLNNTANIIKGWSDLGDSTNYEFIINAAKMFVSPVFDFKQLSFVEASYSALPPFAILYLYPRGILTPGIYTL